MVRWIAARGPFIVEVVSPSERGWSVRVWDVEGALLAETETPAATGDDLPGADAPTNPFPRDRRDQPMRTPRDRGAPPPVPLSECKVGPLREDLCAQVNAELTERGIDYELDCRDIPESLRLPRAMRAEETLIRRCGDLLDPVEEHFEEMFDETAEERCADLRIRVIIQNIRVQLIEDAICRTSPLIVDLDGDGVALSAPADGVAFDLHATGEPVLVAWPTHGDAFLALDVDGDGATSSGAELLGEASFGHTFPDGFTALKTLDGNGDGRLDDDDRGFANLVLWVDTNRNGRSEESELRTLEDAAVRSLSLQPTRVEGAAATGPNGNTMPLRSSFETRDGKSGTIVDAFLRFQPLTCEP